MADGRDFLTARRTGFNVVLTISAPSAPLVSQRHLFQALMAGMVAADVRPLKLEMDLLPNGDLRATACAAYEAFLSDPLADENAETVLTVSVAALEQYGYDSALVPADS